MLGLTSVFRNVGTILVLVVLCGKVVSSFEISTLVSSLSSPTTVVHHPAQQDPSLHQRLLGGQLLVVSLRGGDDDTASSDPLYTMSDDDHEEEEEEEEEERTLAASKRKTVVEVFDDANSAFAAARFALDGEDGHDNDDIEEGVMEEEKDNREEASLDEQDNDEEEQEEVDVEGHLMEGYDDFIGGGEEEEDHETELGDDEQEDNFVMEEVVYKEDERVAAEPEEATIDDEATAAAAATAPPLEPSTTTTQEVLERATAGFQTDDENSSAFVDRMELADAYDVEEAIVVVDVPGEEEGPEATTLAAVSAATAVGPGGSDPDSELGGAPDEDPAAAAPVGEEDRAPGAPATMTNEMKEILVQQLRFTPADVRVLRPEIAAVLVANKLYKPVEGMPLNWYVPDAAVLTKKKMTTTPMPMALRRRLLKASAAIVTVGVVVLVTKGQEGVHFNHVLEQLQSLPKAMVAAIVGSSSSRPTAALPVTVMEEDSTVVVEEEGKEGETSTEEVTTTEDHPHSLKPGSSHAPSYEEDLDKSALDKFLTKIENGIKALFRMKI